MNRQIVYGLTLFTLCLLLDQGTKAWGMAQGISVLNRGFIFGLAQDFPSLLRVMGLVCIFGFLFFFYVMLLTFLPKQLSKLKIGLSLLMGGVFGNVADRVWRGSSIDFIPLPLGDWSVTFNLADAFQWIGAALILYNVIVHERIIWYPENQRGRYLILPREQIRFAAKMASTVLLSAFFLGLFSLTFWREMLLDKLPHHANSTLNFFILSYLSLTLLFSIAVFMGGIILSHRTAGPFYAFEQYVEELLKGRTSPLVLREGDHYQHLTKVADQVRLALKGEKER